ncbi:hypothetical protein ABKN59_008608 [Abortiporus biennis]
MRICLDESSMNIHFPNFILMTSMSHILSIIFKCHRTIKYYPRIVLLDSLILPSPMESQHNFQYRHDCLSRQYLPRDDFPILWDKAIDISSHHRLRQIINQFCSNTTPRTFRHPLEKFISPIQHIA